VRLGVRIAQAAGCRSEKDETALVTVVLVAHVDAQIADIGFIAPEDDGRLINHAIPQWFYASPGACVANAVAASRKVDVTDLSRCATTYQHDL
jgi:hypothetical protein